MRRELDRQKEADRERLIREDQEEQNNKYLRVQKLDAAARRRLYCDASAVQKLQREEKGKDNFTLLGGIALAQAVPPTATPFSVAWSVCLSYVFTLYLTLLVMYFSLMSSCVMPFVGNKDKKAQLTQRERATTVHV